MDVVGAVLGRGEGLWWGWSAVGGFEVDLWVWGGLGWSRGLRAALRVTLLLWIRSNDMVRVDIKIDMYC